MSSVAFIYLPLPGENIWNNYIWSSTGGWSNYPTHWSGDSVNWDKGRIKTEGGIGLLLKSRKRGKKVVCRMLLPDKHIALQLAQTTVCQSVIHPSCAIPPWDSSVCPSLSSHPLPEDKSKRFALVLDSRVLITTASQTNCTILTY